jgi:M6 family metalloprotease-like protein
MKKRISMLIFNIICLMLILASSVFGYSTNTIEIQAEQQNLTSFNGVYQTIAQPNPKTQVNKNSKAINKKLTYIAVFIEFNDSDSLTSYHLDDPECIANAEKIFNSDEHFEMDTNNGIIQVPSFKKYYEMQSYGKLSIKTEIFPRQNGTVVSYKDPKPMSYYLKYSDTNPNGYKDANESAQREVELVNNAMAYISNQIETSGITASDIDIENDGIIDAISFFIEGTRGTTSNISWGDLLWSHKSENKGITTTLLGKKIEPYNIVYTYNYRDPAGVFSLNRGSYGTILHEFGHTLGYVDLYRFNQEQNQPVGFYDIMGNVIGSNPQNFLTYFTSEYIDETNWHKPLPEISATTQNITLYKPEFIDDNEKRAIKIQCGQGNQEYFIVEYHEKQNTYSSHSADESGIIVYRVNEKNKFSGNKDGGDHGENDHIFVFRPNETNLGDGKGNLSQATLNMNRSKLGKNMKDSNEGFDNQTIYFSNGSNSGIIIEVTGQTAESVTFNVTFQELQGAGTQDNPYLIYDTDTFLYLMQQETKNKYYRIENNLDFSGVTKYPKIDFQGHLEGNNKTLSNITTIGTGLFANIGDYGGYTVIQNLNIENININPGNGDYLGGFASVITDTTIKNINLKSGSVTNIASSINPMSSTGGFAGNVSNSTVIENCHSSLKVHSEKNVGGFLGLNMNATIKNCHSYGEVSGNANIGAFIGLQCIMDNTYKVPQDAYYYYTENSIQNAVGGYSSLHNLVALPEESLANGIVGILNKGPETPIIVSEEEALKHFGIIKKGEYVIGFNVGSNVSDIRQLLSSYPNVRLISFRNANDNEIWGGNIATNMKFTLEFNQAQYNYTVVIKGDVNGDGAIYATDYVKIRNHIMKGTNLYGAYLLAADVNNDGNVYATDYVKIRNYIMGRGNIEQK